MDAPRLPSSFRLGPWLVSPRTGTLRSGDELVRVDDRALRVLARLAETPGEVVGIDALLDAAWPDVVVSPDSVYQAVATLRRALGDTAREPAYIATVPRQGYRLVAEVGWDRPAADAGAGAHASVAAAPGDASTPPGEAGAGAAMVTSEASIASALPGTPASLDAWIPPAAPDSPHPGVAEAAAPGPVVPARRPGALGPTSMLLAVALLVLAVGAMLVVDRSARRHGAEAASAPAVAGASAPTGATAPSVASAGATGGADAPARSVAVLPFADLTDAMDKEPFADGVAEQVIEALGRLPGAHVASRTDSVAIPAGRPVAEVARRLRVRWLVEGSVRKSGERLRVTASLVRAESGEVAWSHDWDSRSADALKLQDDVAAEVARALQQAWAVGG
jgi:TolB-like protein/DNA-binding winged helix-turn-helix (wHTH) protein